MDLQLLAGQLLAAAAALHALLGIVNRLLPAKWQAHWLGRLVDLLGALPQPGKTGALGLWSPPLCASKDGPAPKSPLNLLPILALAAIGSLAACHGHVAPPAAQFGAAFGACMEGKGLSAGMNLGGQAFGILDSGSGDVLGRLEGLFTTQEAEALGIQAAKDAVSCAVQAWFGGHPVGDAGAPSKSQAAARVFLARRALGL